MEINDELSLLVASKCFNAVSDLAVELITTEFGWDEVHDTIDSMSRVSKNFCVAQYGEENVLVFKGNLKTVKEKINLLPNKLTKQERNVVIEKIKKLTGCKSVDWETLDANECVFEAKKDNGWHGKIVDGVKLRFRSI